MKYRHRFRVPAFIERVAEFRAHSANMATITLPPFIVQAQLAPPVFAEGDKMDYTIGLALRPGLAFLFTFLAWKTKRVLS
jgi:hypothetical protein